MENPAVASLPNMSAAPKAPMFLDPNHYLSSKSGQEILSAIEACLAQFKNIDVQKKEATFVCHAYVHYASTEIWINVYERDAETRIIEFQRRCGDGYGYCEVVRSVKAYLQAHDIISLPSPSSRTKSSAWAEKAKVKAAAILAAAKSSSASSSSAPANIALPGLNLPPLKVTEESVRACLTHMLNMAKPGGYNDVRTEALRTIASISIEKEVIEILEKSPDYLETLLGCLSDKNTDIHRLATSILANVSSSEKIREILREKNLLPIFTERIASSPVQRVASESRRAREIIFPEEN